MSQRLEFVRLASNEGTNFAALCRRFGISRKTGYKWLARFDCGEDASLRDRSRRPLHSPNRTVAEIEELVIDLRRKHPTWGGRKLRYRLLALGHETVPASSTITGILHRHTLIDPRESEKRVPVHRFEHAHPNDLWQMDFKGDFPLAGGGRCYPLTVLDDHSRYNLLLRACGNQRTATVHEHLVGAFRLYGMPRRMLMDNGSPWSSSNVECHWTKLSVWLLRLDIGVSHGRPYHPQTQGKEERFHRTLKADVLRWHRFIELSDTQHRFDPWRDVYNHERPHEALGMATPGERYVSSQRSYPETLPPIEYDHGDVVRKVAQNAGLVLHGRRYVIGKAFRGHPVALRPTKEDGVWDVYFCSRLIRRIDERRGTSVACHRGRSARSARRTTSMELP